MKFVDKLSGRLGRYGFKYWLDNKDIKAGDDLPTKVQEGIFSSTLMIYVVSKHSEKSTWCREELSTAKYLSKKNAGYIIIPILIGSTVPRYLQNILYLNMAKWRNRADFDREFERLAEAITGSGLSSIPVSRSLVEITDVLKDKSQLFVTTWYGDVVKMSLSGKTIKRVRGLRRPHSCTTNPLDRSIYVANTYNDEVLKFDRNLMSLGKVIFNIPLFHPHSITFDPSGFCYIADTDTHSVIKLDQSFNLLARFGSTSGVAGSSSKMLNTPCGIWADDKLTIVADTYNHRLVALDTGFKNVKISIVGKTLDPPFWKPVSVERFGDLLFVANEDYTFRRLQLWKILVEKRELTLTLIKDNMLPSTESAISGLWVDKTHVYTTDRNSPRLFRLELDKLPRVP